MDHLVVVTLWLLFLAITGIVNIISYPGIWRAWDISRAVDCKWLFFSPVACRREVTLPNLNFAIHPDFIRTGNYDALTGVVLAVTGCEALFAK